MADIRVVYDDFTGGEYGHIGGAKAPENSFTGRNVVVHPSGLIGPRAGIRPAGLSGTSAAAIWGMGWNGHPGADHWWIQGTEVRSRNGTVAEVWTGALNTEPTKPVQSIISDAGQTLATSYDDTLYLLDHNAKTITDIYGPGGTDIAIVGERAFVCRVGAGDERRVHYSEAGDFTIWPSENFFDVGKRSGIASIEGQSDHLAILLEDGSWWVYRGIGATASLRRVTAGDWYPWTPNPGSARCLTGDNILYMGQLGDWPILFNGARLDEVRQAGPFGDGYTYVANTDILVLRGRRPEEGLIALNVNNGGVLTRLYYDRDGVWCLHNIATGPTSGYASSDTQNGLYLLSDGGGANFWWWDPSLDRPGFTSDSFSQPGDSSDTPLDAHFQLPEWWSQPGTDVRVRQITVDFVKYATGSATPNNITLDVAAIGMFGNDGSEAPATQSWNEAGALASTGGTRDRVTFNIGEQGYGSGYQLGLTALKGVAIKTITVVLETSNHPRF